MKINLFFSYLKSFIVCMLFVAESYGQSASATWPLTADTTVTVAGNVNAPGQVLSSTSVATDTMTVKDYTGGGAVGVAERLWLNGTSCHRKRKQQRSLCSVFYLAKIRQRSHGSISVAQYWHLWNESHACKYFLLRLTRHLLYQRFYMMELQFCRTYGRLHSRFIYML